MTTERRDPEFTKREKFSKWFVEKFHEKYFEKAVDEAVKETSRQHYKTRTEAAGIAYRDRYDNTDEIIETYEKNAANASHCEKNCLCPDGIVFSGFEPKKNSELPIITCQECGRTLLDDEEGLCRSCYIKRKGEEELENIRRRISIDSQSITHEEALRVIADGAARFAIMEEEYSSPESEAWLERTAKFMKEGAADILRRADGATTTYETDWNRGMSGKSMMREMREYKSHILKNREPPAVSPHLPSRSIRRRLMRKKILRRGFASLLLIFALAGCTKIVEDGQSIYLYSGGQLIESYENIEGLTTFGPGYSFIPEGSRRRIKISGDIIIK